MHLQELEQQRLEQEMAIGRRIQHSLLPESLPSLAGWEFAAYYQAAREVGGDFYDFFEPMASPNPPGAQDRRDSSHSLGLFIADVTGKGVPAALMMAFSRALLRTLLRTGAQLAGRPAEVLRRMNSLLLHDNRTGLLLTALYAALDPASGRLFYANAGHERPVWVRTAARECIELISPGAILGAFPHFAFEERQVDLAPGDLIVFYTDGVTEARNPQGALFGEERLLETLTAGLGAGAEETAQTILGAVQGFAAGTPQADDFTVVVIQRSGN
jgi:sigma-B regulation protein RsbU (phosphoserine phosphatase)